MLNVWVIIISFTLKFSYFREFFFNKSQHATSYSFRRTRKKAKTKVPVREKKQQTTTLFPFN